MSRAVVSVATTDHYCRGQARLRSALEAVNQDYETWQHEAAGWPMHRDKPYAMKAYALKAAVARGHETLLWCDSCIVPVKPLGPLWERIERDGYWMSANGFSNAEWTAESAYTSLLPLLGLEAAVRLNRTIPHVVATAFGISLKHELGRAFLEEYFRLASETRAFCGPWINSNAPGARRADGVRCAPCGPPDVRGHRHDQAAASVIAWRLGFQLTSAPDIFAYGKLGDALDERTVLLADGSY